MDEYQIIRKRVESCNDQHQETIRLVHRKDFPTMKSKTAKKSHYSLYILKAAHNTNEIFRAAPKTDASYRYMIFHTDAHSNCVISK